MTATTSSDTLITAVNLRLALLGLPRVAGGDHADAELVSPLLDRQRELSRRLSDRLPPVDERIEDFLADYLDGVEVTPRLPRRTFTLDVPGLARTLSLPVTSDEYSSDLITSYRLANGVLHNPRNDRRTTAGVFHIAEGGLPIPDDKKAVPREVFARLLAEALAPPPETLELPITSTQPERASCFVSLLLRPLVVVPAPGHTRERRMETRFIVPGSMVANLDFVEGIFGNAGDPYLPENDAALDPLGWTGHTGLVILAPHLTGLTKKDLGLPHIDDATDRQVRDGMCWSDEAERYNDGQAFKVCARDERGVIVTVIADNYFGYCKKEVKTQISMSANLFGGAEEEHSGGAMVFPSWDQGQEFLDKYGDDGPSVEEVVAANPHEWIVGIDGLTRHATLTHLVLMPGRARYSLGSRSITWTDAKGETRTTPFRGDTTYVNTSGFRIRMLQVRHDPAQWTIIGTSARTTVCHKPSTVSGGGKSEISKSIADAITIGTAHVADLDADLDAVEAIFARDYSQRYAEPSWNGQDHRPLLGPNRSMGSIIKLLTPSSEFSDEHNAFIRSIPPHVMELVFVIKEAYQPEWGEDWRSHFSVSRVNGRHGTRLRMDGQPVLVDMLRVGFEEDGSYRLFSLRPDFAPAAKLQTEDDITASVTVPDGEDGSRKYVQNCESLLFQRPDDAITPGYDTIAEADIAQPGTFLSNFEPLDRAAAQAMTDDAIALSQFTAPMRDLLTRFASRDPSLGDADYVACSARPRLVDGKPSKNPRYLQVRPDLADPEGTAEALVAVRLHRGLAGDAAVPMGVDIVAAGRRNNPPEPGVPALCAFSPLHYLELPELLMEFISSMTGKSPSTTGAGSEGALTKAPFNALPTTYDLNAAFLSYALSGYDGWISGAGYVGPQVRVDHDVSLLIPEIFARMSDEERSAERLIAAGHLEPVTDLEVDGRTVPASRLGYRITESFTRIFLGRIFMHPNAIFTEAILRPETQDRQVFIDSIDVMVETHERVARSYLKDGTIASACPPVRALIEIMADGVSAEGWTLDDPAFRALFTRESVLASDWYRERLDAAQAQAVAQAETGIARLEDFLEQDSDGGVGERLALRARLDAVRAARDEAASPATRERLIGALGRQPTFTPPPSLPDFA
ncbi:hypothetical protein [Janibacter sp. GXQ6167]|uniref:hypothetical protein n=1 Tax=Janibacter sp. GXQ6167 TaxID=3240791 RepID=UPI00352511CE